MAEPRSPQEPAASPTGPSGPRLSGVVVHWRNPRELRKLVAGWPRDPRFELIVVDNSAHSEPAGVEPSDCPGISLRILEPATNLGFGGGANLGIREARAPRVLLLNPDIELEEGALENLLEGFDLHPDAAGLAPRLTSPKGEPQFRWQLRALPGPGTLVAQAFGWPAGRGTDREPAPGTPVEQPAAAALALRRQTLVAVGGFDEDFYPAWFEDVDLARRLAARGERFVYWPQASARHGLGSSVPALGYGRFLWVYHRNLLRYLRKHHGAAWTALAVVALAKGLLLRLVLLPVRCPRRARGRGEAARGLLANLLGLVSAWGLPRTWARELSRPEGPSGEGR